jgi:hypothetical protein
MGWQRVALSWPLLEVSRGRWGQAAGELCPRCGLPPLQVGSSKGKGPAAGAGGCRQELWPGGDGKKGPAVGADRRMHCGDGVGSRHRQERDEGMATCEEFFRACPDRADARGVLLSKKYSFHSLKKRGLQKPRRRG